MLVYKALSIASDIGYNDLLPMTNCAQGCVKVCDNITTENKQKTTFACLWGVNRGDFNVICYISYWNSYVLVSLILKMSV